LAATAIVLLILGYTYLKGLKLLDKGVTYYATFENVAGLRVDDDVMMNGMEVGRITTMSREAKVDSVTISVAFEIDDDNLKIPINSEVRISVDLLGSVALELALGDSTVVAEPGHVFKGTYVPGIQERVERALDPVISSVTRLVANVDSVVTQIEAVFDPQLAGDVQSQMNDVREAISNIRNITERLDDFLAEQTSELTDIVGNVKSITDSLDASKGDISQTIRNFRTVSDSLAFGGLNQILNDLETTIHEISVITARLNDPNNSLGKMLSDKELYDQIVATLDSFSVLAKSWARSIEVNIRLGRNKERTADGTASPQSD
jgi:phospholipid/cholesterol/gamma-HCH transport system substrate-binding protein